MSKTLAELEAENAALRKQIGDLLLTPYLSRAGVNEAALDYVAFKVRDNYSMSSEGELTPKTPGMVPQSWHRYIEGLRHNEPHLFGRSRTVRAGGTSGPNPFKKETFNLTQQALLKRRDPALAEQMAAEAGE